MGVPLQTELHRHLDVSTRPSTLLEILKSQGDEAQSTSLEAFQEKVCIREPMGNLETVLAQFTVFQKALSRPENLERIAYETVEDCYREGTRRAELRFSPSFVCEHSGLPWDEALDAFERGLKRAIARFPGMRAGFLCIASRDYGVDVVDETVEFFLKHRARFAGFDLAGNETQFPCHLFERPFKKLIAACAKITIHAGEAAGPENIWEAIELLGAKRIGHGIASIRDPKLLDYLSKNRICLEMCPTSNWLTHAVPTLSAHPLPRVLAAGVPVCINTDDPGIFGVTLQNEISICQQEMKMSSTEIALCMAHAEAASFL